MKHSDRPVAVHYYRRGEINPFRTSYQNDLNRATSNCFHHMMIEHYGADIAQVVRNPSGIVYAEFVWKKNGKLDPTFHEKTAPHETRYSIKSLLGDLA